jgi:hypothetical protein
VLGGAIIAGHFSSEAAHDSTKVEASRLSMEAVNRMQDIQIDAIPDLLSSDPVKRQAAKAALLRADAHEAEQTFKVVAEVAAGEAAGSAQEAVAQAKEVQAAVGPWGIVVGTDTSQASAQDEVKRAAKAGLAATLYHRRSQWVTIATGFDSETQARSVLPSARGKVRPSAYVVALNIFCPSPRQVGNTVECQG